MHICFVSAIGGSAFMHELLGVVAEEVSGLGVTTSLHEGSFPELTGEMCYVVVPHEYFVVTPELEHPSAAQRARTIAFAVEHPGNDTFEVSQRWCRTVAAVVDINEDSRVELARRGIRSERFELGYSRRWDNYLGSDAARPIDVTYLGTTEPRRSRALASYAETLATWNVELLTPPHEPMVRPRPDFKMGTAKYDHLRRSKLLLNLHRGSSWSLEWVRVLEAICNGCVVVGEHSPDAAPLVPGEHIVFGDARSLGDIAALLLRDPSKIDAIRTSAYDFVRTNMSMRESAGRLIAIAEELASGRATPVGAYCGGVEEHGVPIRDVADWAMVAPPDRVAVPDESRGALCELLGLVPKALEPAGQSTLPAVDIDVLVASTRPSQSPEPAIGSVQMGATSMSVRTLTWSAGPGLREYPTAAGECDLVEVGVGQVTRASALNRLLARSRSTFVLVVDPEVRLFPGAVDRLMRALSTAPEAAAVFPMYRTADRTIGNALPFEAARLERHPYLGSLALWRREWLVELGGWNEDPALGGHEDHELWRELARREGTAIMVQQVLATRSAPMVPELQMRDVEPARAWLRANEPRRRRPGEAARL